MHHSKPRVVDRIRRAAAATALLGVVMGSASYAVNIYAEAKTAAAFETTTRVSRAALDTMRAVQVWETAAALSFDRQRTTALGGEPPGTDLVVEDLDASASAVDEAFSELHRVAPAEADDAVDAARSRWTEARRLAAVSGTDVAIFRQVLKDLQDLGQLLEVVREDVVAANDALLDEVDEVERNVALGVLALLILVAMALATWAKLLADRLGRGFRAIELATQRLAENDLEHRVPPFPEAEIDQLGRCVNGMATRLRLTQRQLERQAATDPLTQLPNRRAVFELLEELLGRGSDAASKTFVIIDLDGFKEINDSFGHLAGDQVLVELAQRLRDLLRPGDVVARLGGDEFALLLDHGSDVHQVEGAVQAVLDAVRRPLQLPGLVVNVGASAGIVSLSGLHDAEELVRNTDVAMYAAKGHGRGSYCWFEPWMQTEVAERLAMQSTLTTALEADQFVLHYQPILVAGTGHVASVEALVRWEHPQLGLLGPGRFIPLAETTGFILPLGSLVLSKALAMIPRLDRLPGGQDMRVNVNLAPRQLQSTSLVDEVLTVLESTGSSPDRLVLEITESALIEDLDFAISQLQGLKQLGVRLALDDFGVGYSSLGYLARLPVDSIKIDRSLTEPVLTSLRAAAIVRAVVDISAITGASVVAEGVETQAQAEALVGMGCHHLQGFLYSKPVPAADLEEVLGALHADDRKLFPRRGLPPVSRAR